MPQILEAVDQTKLLETIKGRQKQTEFNYGILTADRYVATLQDAIGLDRCYKWASRGTTSFTDILKEAAQTLVYSNSDMVVKEAIRLQNGQRLEGIDLPKNTLMVFEHVLTTSRKDRDGDVLQTTGARIDPNMPLLWQHVPTLPIGKLLAVTNHTKDRLSVISAIVDLGELAHDAAVMIDNKMGRFSHGFRALDFAELEAKDGEEGPFGFEIKSFEIMEESLVSVPANTDAETLDVMLSLVERGKLTSPIMKEFGKGIRSQLPVTIVSGIQLKGESDEDKSRSGGETESEEHKDDSITPKETEANVEQTEEVVDAKNEDVGASDTSEVLEALEEKSGRTFSKQTLQTLTDIEADLVEVYDKEHENISRGSKALIDTCRRRLRKMIESQAEPAEDEAEKTVSVKDAMALFLSEADADLKSKMLSILQVMQKQSEVESQAKQFRVFVGTN